MNFKGLHCNEFPSDDTSSDVDATEQNTTSNLCDFGIRWSN